MKKFLPKPKYWYYEEMSDGIFVDYFDADFGTYHDFITRIGRARTGKVEELISLIRGKQFFFSKYNRKQLLELISNEEETPNS